jgi:hypothetical protein
MSTYPYGAFVSTTPFPISMGEVLDKLWKTLRGNWKLYLWLGAPLAAVGILFMAAYFGALFASGVFPLHPGVAPDPTRLSPWLFGVMLIGYVPNLIVFALYQAATTFATLREASGQKTTVREAYAAAWRKAGRNCWLMILQYLCVAGPILVFAVIASILTMVFGSGGTPNPAAMFVIVPLIFLLVLGAFAYAIWMALCLGMAFPASVAEDLPAIAALKRSSRLSCGVKGKLFLALLVVLAISYAAIFALEIGGGGIIAVGALLFQLLHLSVALGIALGVIAALAFLVLMFACTSLIWAAYSISFTIVYCDQRVRLDGPIGGFSQIQPEAPLA